MSHRAAPLAGRALAPAGGSFVVTEATDGGGGFDPPRYLAPLHIHHADDEVFYVLEGALRFIVCDDEIDAPAGTAVLVPRGTRHTLWNPRPEPARYLLVMTPGIHRLIEAIHEPGPSETDMEALFRAHDATLIGWP